jgi:hypothetical protein
MSSFGGLILTNKGRALQAKVQAGATLHFTRIGVGDGNLGSQSIPDLNALISEKKSLTITKLKTQSGGKAIVGGVLSNQDVTVGFYFREIGLFAQDPDVGEILYCYANAGAGAEYISPGGGADVIEKTIDIIALTANAANVSATLDSSLVYASQQDLQNHIADRNNPHQVTAAQVGAIPVAAIGQAGGVAPLDSSGKVPTANLPAMNYIPTSAEGAANGVATLDGSGRVVQDANNALNLKVGSSSYAGSQSATPNTVAVRDQNGKLAGDITGNAGTATKLQNARTIALAGDVSGSASFDGSANVTISATLTNYNVTASNPDANGKYTVVTYKRTDGTTYMVSTLSNGPDANGNYGTMTNVFYKADGVTVDHTDTWTFTHDSNGKMISRTVVTS